MKSHPARTRPGFTLVELLVVIAIVAVLVVLFIVGFRLLKAAADKVTATRNIAQLQIANTAYATDHGGIYMPVWAFDSEGSSGNGWFANTTFLSYMVGEDGIIRGSRNVRTVPQHLLDPVVIRARKFDYDLYSASFGYNNTTKGASGYGSPNATLLRRTGQISSPERSMAFITATDWMAKYSGRFLWKGAAAVEGKTGDGKIAFRHGGKALVVYFDGHVGEVTIEDLENFDQNGGNKHPFWLPTQ